MHFEYDTKPHFFGAAPGLSLLATLWLGACGGEPTESWALGPPEQREDAERWQPVDNPSAMGIALELRLARLPPQGAVAQAPWPGSHWPTFRDSINHRWQGSDRPSPVEKYAQAFGGGRLEDAVSRQHGIASAGGRSCEDDAGCHEGYACARRRGETRGHCVSKWWGICDGWASASVLTPEPSHPVTVRGVRFEVNDIKALLSYAYLGSPSYMVGGRCNEPEVSVDRNKRPVRAACRDTNAGSFHLLLANVVGIHERNIIVDQDLGPRVFN